MYSKSVPNVENSPPNSCTLHVEYYTGPVCLCTSTCNFHSFVLAISKLSPLDITTLHDDYYTRPVRLNSS